MCYWKQFAAACLAVLFLLPAVPAFAAGKEDGEADNQRTVVRVNTFEELQTALENSTGQEYEVSVNSDITSEESLVISKDVTLYISSHCTLTVQNILITQNANVVLSVDFEPGFTIEGKIHTAETEDYAVRIDSDGDVSLDWNGESAGQNILYSGVGTLQVNGKYGEIRNTGTGSVQIPFSEAEQVINEGEGSIQIRSSEVEQVINEGEGSIALENLDMGDSTVVENTGTGSMTFNRVASTGKVSDSGQGRVLAQNCTFAEQPEHIVLWNCTVADEKINYIPDSMILTIKRPDYKIYYADEFQKAIDEVEERYTSFYFGKGTFGKKGETIHRKDGVSYLLFGTPGGTSIIGTFEAPKIDTNVLVFRYIDFSQAEVIPHQDETCLIMDECYWGGTAPKYQPGFVVGSYYVDKEMTQLEGNDQNAAVDAAVKKLPETIFIPSAEANTKEAVLNWLNRYIQELYQDDLVLAYELTEDDLLSFQPAVDGTRSNRNGTDGAFRFEVYIKYYVIGYTPTVTGVITAERYSGPSGGSSSGDGSHSGSRPSHLPVRDEETEGNQPGLEQESAPVRFRSDTNSDFTVNGTYQFRITSLDGSVPVMTASNDHFTVSLAGISGNDYFFVITASGAAGSTSTIAVNGQNLLTVTVGSSGLPDGVTSDTTAPFTVRKGNSYQFQLTASARPSFAAGSPSFRAEFIGKEGNHYFFKVYAIGQPGEACGFYIDKAPTPVAVATIV